MTGEEIPSSLLPLALSLSLSPPFSSDPKITNWKVCRGLYKPWLERTWVSKGCPTKTTFFLRKDKRLLATCKDAEDCQYQCFAELRQAPKLPVLFKNVYVCDS